MKKGIILLALLLTTVAGYSQIAVNANNNGTLGLDYQFGKVISAGVRFNYGELKTNNITPLITANVKETEDVSFYIGIGLKGLDPVDVVSVPVGLRVFPMKEKTQLAFTMELDSQIGDKYNVVPSIGLYYRFGKK